MTDEVTSVHSFFHLLTLYACPLLLLLLFLLLCTNFTRIWHVCSLVCLLMNGIPYAALQWGYFRLPNRSFLRFFSVFLIKQIIDRKFKSYGLRHHVDEWVVPIMLKDCIAVILRVILDCLTLKMKVQWSFRMSGTTHPKHYVTSQKAWTLITIPMKTSNPTNNWRIGNAACS